MKSHVFYIISALLLWGCSEGDLPAGGTSPLDTREIRFSVQSEAGTTWNAAATRADGGVSSPAGRETLEPVRLSGGRLPGGEELWLETVIEGNDFTLDPGKERTTQGATRAAPVTGDTFTGPFGVSAYHIPQGGAWSETLLPGWMYNVRIRDKANGVWSPSVRYLWPGTGSLRFFAYSPYNSLTMEEDNTVAGTPEAGYPVLSSASAEGSPRMRYEVDADVSKQTDVLVASTGASSGGGTVGLDFKHALTAVKFVTGDNLTSCTLESVSIEGVYYSGIYDFKTGAWTPDAGTRDFSQTLNKSVTNTSGVAVTAAAQTFMMLPQTLPAGATIKAVLYNGTSRLTLTASVAGMKWVAGKTVIYRISRNSFMIDWTFYPNGTHNEGSSEGNLVWNTSKTYPKNALRKISANGEPYRLTVTYPSTVQYALVRLRYDDYVKTDNNDDGTPDSSTGDPDTEVIEYFGTDDANPRAESRIPLHHDKGKTVLEGYTCFLNKGSRTDASTNLYYARQWETRAVVEAMIVSDWAFVITDADGNATTYNPSSDSGKWFTLWEGTIFPPNYFSPYEWADLGTNFYKNGDNSAGHLWARYDNSYTLRAVSASSKEVVYRAEGGLTTAGFNKNRHSEIKGHPVYGRADGLDASDNTSSSSTDISPDGWEVPDWDYGTRILGLADFIRAIDWQSQIDDNTNTRMNDIFGHKYYDNYFYGDYGTAKYTGDGHTDIIAVSGETIYNTSTLQSLTSADVYSTGKFEHYGVGKELLVRLVVKKYGMPDLNATMPYARAWKNSTYRYCNDVTDE